MFPSLKPFQKEALQSLFQNPHTILIAPTGSGKSLVFQKYLFHSKASPRAILVSPLNALARQLAEGLQKLGLQARLGIGRQGEPPPSGSGIWIVSPEKLLGAGLSRAKAWQPNLLIVDEAHCVWEWGERFRPEFAELPHLVSQLQIEKSFWCSATLPRHALLRIEEKLPEKASILGRFSIPESIALEKYRVLPHQKLDRLRTRLENTDPRGGGMIFVSSRASAERLQFYLHAWGFRSVFYHAGLSAEERIAIEKSLSHLSPNTEPHWVVATSAFGMGMDYPFLKTCIVFDPSRTLLSLAQAIGRVGRSGASATADVYWHENDFLGLESRITDSESLKRLAEVKTWCMSQESARFHLEKYFNEA